VPLEARKDDISVRVMQLDEFDTMRAVSVAAFGGDPQIAALLDALRASWAWDDELSFVAERGDEIVGHVLYSHAILDAPDRLVDVLLLSPVGVLSALQLQGVGSALITESLSTIAQRTEPIVFLEGHPSYYPRLGFHRAGDYGFIAPSVRIPADAFMMFPLPNFDLRLSGQLVCPDAFWRADAVGLR
jgi:putative acetyltransferase